MGLFSKFVKTAKLTWHLWKLNYDVSQTDLTQLAVARKEPVEPEMNYSPSDPIAVWYLCGCVKPENKDEYGAEYVYIKEYSVLSDDKNNVIPIISGQEFTPAISGIQRITDKNSALSIKNHWMENISNTKFYRVYLMESHATDLAQAITSKGN